ncbi:MAG: BrnA antitoxin family protein [Terriglobia bacterium]
MSAKITKRRSRTDWNRIEAIKDEDIDFSDIPEQGGEFFKHAVLWPGTKRQITLRLDPDVLLFFQKRGRGYQTTINAVLRRYMEVQMRRAS